MRKRQLTGPQVAAPLNSAQKTSFNVNSEAATMRSWSSTQSCNEKGLGQRTQTMHTGRLEFDKCPQMFTKNISEKQRKAEAIRTVEVM